MFSCKYLNFSRSTSDLDLMTRKAIFELEGTNEISDELLNEYADENSQKHQNMVDAICKAMGFDTLKYHRLDDLIEDEPIISPNNKQNISLNDEVEDNVKSDLQKELEKKFDELFGPLDDD